MKRRAIPAISLALVVLFSASFLLALPGAVSMPASAVTQAEIDALKESAGELEQQQKEIQAQLNAIAADKDEALEQKSLLEQQINVIQSEINNIGERVRYMEEEGEVSYWAILFNAEDFSDMLDRFMMVEEIMAYDNAIMDELLATQAQIEQEKAELEEARTAQEEARQKQADASQAEEPAGGGRRPHQSDQQPGGRVGGHGGQAPGGGQGHGQRDRPERAGAPGPAGCPGRDHRQ